MLNKIIDFSVRNKSIVLILTLAWLIYGLYEVTKLPIDAVPDITNNQVQVITTAPSYGATDIERLVTFPIEQGVSNISGMIEMRSFSRFGLSVVTLVFKDDVDLYWARQQVSERLIKVQQEIPADIEVPELGPISTGLGEIFQYVVRAKKGYEKKYDVTELRTMQDWIVRRQLLGVEGVAEVSSFGGKLKQYEIAIHPNKLHSYGITIENVFNALEKNNQNTGGSYIEREGTALFIRSIGLIGQIEDIQNIPITGVNKTLLLKDVAEVQIGHATRYGALCYNDEGEVAGAIVMMLKGANSSDVIDRVKERVAAIQATLPEGVVIEPFLDRSKMVRSAINTVEKNLLEGALIVLFVLVLFLGNFRAGLLVASVIPLAMLFAVIMMNTFGVSGNLMSLGALDFGLIVDGAVIIVEAVLHQIAKHQGITGISKERLQDEVRYSASKMMNSAVFGQLIILIVYLPILSLHGIEGKMFKPMAQTVAFALLGAFILSVTYIPMMSAWILQGKLSHGFTDKWMAKLEEKYKNGLQRSMLHTRKILLSVIVLFILSIITLMQLGGEFIPTLEEGDFAVETRVLSGSNLKTTIEHTQKAAGLLKNTFPEVEKVVTKIGSGEVPTDPMPMEAADMMVILKDQSQWTSAETYDELSEKMSKALEAIPGVTFGFQYPVQMRFNELMTGARQDVVCKIFGEDLDTLAHYAHLMGNIIQTVEGAENLYEEPVTGIDQVVIKYNRALLAEYHLDIASINQTVHTAFAGNKAGSVYEGEKRFDLVVRLDNTIRSNVDDIQNLLITTPSGVQMPLSQVADVNIQSGPNQIQREFAKRRIVVGFNVKGRDVESIVQELTLKMKKQVQLPVGYFVTYGGSFENLQQAKNRLMIAVPIALLLIFMLLYFAFHKVEDALLIYAAIPFSMIGGVFFLTLRGMPFSISAGVGFIALFGVAVLNGIVLLAEFNHLMKQIPDNLTEVVLQGTKNRLRPVLMTACVASFGFLPMALSVSPGSEVQRPLATVVIGGLFTATLLTLFVIPLLFIKMKTRKVKIHSGVNKVILFFAIFSLQSIKAQTPITLSAALDMALKNSKSVQQAALKEKYQALLIKNSSVAPLNITMDYGQINSAYHDTKFGVNQPFDLPTVYQRQKKVRTSEWQEAALNTDLKRFEVKKYLTFCYAQLWYLQEKGRILQKSDSIYSSFQNKADIRFKAGESDALEQSSAAISKGNAGLQLLEVREQTQILNALFSYLVGKETTWEMMNGQIRLEIKLDSSYILENPALKVYEQQVELASLKFQADKALLLPNFSLGYSNGSFYGVGPDNIFYNKSSRFQSVQIGIGIPVFAGGQRSRIKADKVAMEMAKQAYEMQEQALKKEKEKLLIQFRSQRSRIQYFEQQVLKDAERIVQTANLQLSKGAINYLDWSYLINQSLAVQHNYIDVLATHQETIIQLNYLETK